MTGRAIDPVDTIWLNMDRANNLMVIESLMMLEDRWTGTGSSPCSSNGCSTCTRCSASARCRHACRCWPPHWEDDADFSLSRHIHRVTLPRRATMPHSRTT